MSNPDTVVKINGQEQLPIASREEWHYAGFTLALPKAEVEALKELNEKLENG